MEKNPRLVPCVAEVGKIIGIGLNYSDHSAETGMEVPSEPFIFLKANSSINGPNEPLVIPRGSKKTDYEVELEVVIGAPGKYIDASDAGGHIAG